MKDIFMLTAEHGGQPENRARADAMKAAGNGATTCLWQLVDTMRPGKPTWDSETPARAAEPERYRVGDVVEAAEEDGRDTSTAWARAEIIEVDDTDIPYYVRFLDGREKYRTIWRYAIRIRRPVTPHKFEPVAGARVRTVGAQSDDEQREGAIVCVAPPYVWVELSSGPHKNLAVRRIASQVHPI